MTKKNGKKQNGCTELLYLYSSNGDLPPVFTFYFENLDVGKEIFKDLINKVGKEDKDERLRLSIIEGDVPKQECGYFVTIGENVDATNKLLEDDVRYVAIGQRIHRMKPKKDSTNLRNFKKEYEKHGCYHIAPGKQLYDPEKGYGSHVEMDYSILKRKIEFRSYKDINESNDPDSILKI